MKDFARPACEALTASVSGRNMAPSAARPVGTHQAADARRHHHQGGARRLRWRAREGTDYELVSSLIGIEKPYDPALLFSNDFPRQERADSALSAAGHQPL